MALKTTPESGSRRLRRSVVGMVFLPFGCMACPKPRQPALPGTRGAGPGYPGNPPRSRDFTRAAAHNQLMTAVPATASTLRAPGDSTRIARTVVACALATVALALLAATIALTLLDTGSKWWLMATTAILVPAIGGGLIAVYRPSNPIGWLLLADGVNVAFAFLATPYAHYGLITNHGSLPGVRWMLLWSSAGWPALFAIMIALAFVFPDGRLPTRRWRPVATAAVVCFSVLQVAVLFEPQNYVAPFTEVTSPIPSLPSLVRTALTPFWIGAFATFFVAAWAIRVRFRRAAGVERLQLLWLTYGALLIPLTLVACLVESRVHGSEGDATAVVLTATLTIIPAAICVAVFRYRLFD